MVKQLYMISSILLSSIIILFALFLTGYLQRNSNKYPYKAISSFWAYILFIIIILSQMYTTITYLLLPYSLNIFVYLQMFNILIFYNLKLVCLFMRTLSLFQGISYNYSHLTQRFLDESFNLVDDIHFKKTFFIRTFRYMKIFLCLTAIISLITFAYFGIAPILDGQFMHYKSIYSFNNSASDKIIEESIFNLNTAIISINSLSYILFALNAFYVIFLFQYNINNDKFNIKTEVMTGCIITYFFFNIIDIIHYISSTPLQIGFLYIRDSLENLSILILYLILCILRYNSFNAYSIDYLKNSFDQFMQFHVTFKLFKDYIKIKQNDYYRYLFFWADYFSFKDKIKIYNQKMIQKRIKNNCNIDEPSFMSSDKFIINENEEALKRFAQMIFKDYFMINSVTESGSRSNTISIDLPSDIYDKLEEMYENNFTVENIGIIFDDAYSWIKDKLEKIFEELKADAQENEKLEKIMFYIKCFEIIKNYAIPI